MASPKGAPPLPPTDAEGAPPAQQETAVSGAQSRWPGVQPPVRSGHVSDALAELDTAERVLDTLLDGPSTAAGLSTGVCSIACAALSSMRRAQASLCELAGDDDERCVSARDRLDRNERRVTDAGCSC